MIGIIASIRRPELFSKLILIGASPRFLNDEDYHGGFEQGEIEKVFSAMEANYEAWVNGFAPVGRDMRGVLGLVKVPCHIFQTARDHSVPASVATYLKNHLGMEHGALVEY
ncbi:DASH complex subunit dad2 [Datura stramonium]|uniref:DASH complex subunit dad2 n=1 Tax=Datura stramonium TaxID=4076 RepID=A0ABS8SPN9_DATST|nr:DASH complex subunit dad2 [Datura stramonium]